MKSSTLACYLESIANAIRQSKSPDVPHIKWTAFKGPRVLHVGSASIPIPTHTDAVADLRAIFPDAGSDPIPQPAQGVQAGVGLVHAEAVALRNANDAAHQMAERLRDSMASNRRNVATIQTMSAELAEVKAERDALRQTVDRMRQGGADLMMRPAPRAQVPMPEAADLIREHDKQTGMEPFTLRQIQTRGMVQPGVDYLSQVLDAENKLADERKAQATVTTTPPVVVVAFRLNQQGKTLAHAGITLEDLRARFTFRFNDPKDATRGGYWLAKDPSAPGTHLMVQRLAEAGAIIGDRLPVGASERLQ